MSKVPPDPRKLPKDLKAEKFKLDLIPSISRSGGDDGEGDRLKNKDVQERYWKMVSERIESHRREFPSQLNKTTSQAERETNILLFLRKLREGLLSSHRRDLFAFDVYEMSFYLAVIFDSPAQAASSLSRLPEIISAILSTPHGTEESDQLRFEALVVSSLVFHLAVTFPSQMMFHHQMESLEALIRADDKDSTALEWVSSVKTSINCRNYTKFEVLTREDRVKAVIERTHYLTVTKGNDDAVWQQYSQMALFSAVDALRRRFRRSVWAILRSAYREFALGSDSDTAPWLARSLLLDSDAERIDVQGWLQQCEKDGHVVRKMGSNGRWIIRR